MPEVTIGMPLYQNAETLKAALESLLTQTVQDIRIVISDDCSRDDTGVIAESYARRDSRVTYMRQEKNLGYQNFRFVLDQADTAFFMWAAGDDRWAPTFIAKNLAVLKSDPSIAGSISKVQFERAGQVIALAHGTYPLMGDVADNILRYLCDPRDNSRMYGLFRTEVLKRSFPSTAFHAYDWALSAATLRYGKHYEVPEVLMFRDRTPQHRYLELVRKDHEALLFRLFPVLHMTHWLIFAAKVPLTLRLAGALLALNVDKHYVYCAKFHPRYTSWTAGFRRLWYKYVQWRLRPTQPGEQR